MSEEQPTFGGAVLDQLKKWGQWAAYKLLAPGVALLIIVGAVILVAMGAKNLQVGGLLSKLLGKADPEKVIDVANSVPSERVDPNGKIIAPGTPDSKGDVQAVVVPIEPSGVLSNPNTVKFIPPGETTPKEVQLPDGVKANDVDKVIIVQPGKFVVTVKDSSGIDAQHIDALLAKYGG
jgi:hypothetical protein